jgi:hypothetical protein
LFTNGIDKSIEGVEIPGTHIACVCGMQEGNDSIVAEQLEIKNPQFAPRDRDELYELGTEIVPSLTVDDQE